ncbi:Lrp/AsnC family transcriptional regulator [Rhodococcus sp. 2.95]
MKPESDAFVIAESDLEIINALQLNPRASWTQLSSVLDMDSTTIARRWRRLVSNGHSWVNAVAIGRTHIFGYLLIRTTQDSVADVGELLRQLSCAYLLARTEGEYEYFVGVVAADHKSLDALVCEHLAADPGILSIRSRVGVKVYRDGFSWEPGALGKRVGLSWQRHRQRALRCRQIRQSSASPTVPCWRRSAVTDVPAMRVSPRFVERTRLRFDGAWPN